MGPEISGPEEVRAGLASRFAGIPDVHHGEERHWLQLFEFKDDKIARKDSYRKRVER